MSNEKNLPYAVVCGGVNIDIGAHSFAPLRAKDSNPGKVELSLGAWDATSRTTCACSAYRRIF